jgi:hypothetical protein
MGKKIYLYYSVRHSDVDRGYSYYTAKPPAMWVSPTPQACLAADSGRIRLENSLKINGK